jgi:hypothetical protein
MGNHYTNVDIEFIAHDAFLDRQSKDTNDSGASCTIQNGLDIQLNNINYADFKGKAILVKTQSNYKIVLFKVSDLLRFRFCLSKPDSSCLSKTYGHVKKGIMWYINKNRTP